MIVTLLLISEFHVHAWSASTPTLAEPAHGYVAKRGDAFVYEKVPPVDSTAPVYVLVWYLGRNSGGPLIRYQDGNMTATLECYEDCQYVRWNEISEGKVISNGRIRVSNDPLIYSIIRDATSGLLN